MIAAIVALLFQPLVAAAQPAAQEVSVAEVLAAPQAYAGKPVRIHGFIILEFEGNSIWSDHAAFQDGTYDQAIWLDLSDVTETEMDAALGRVHGRMGYVSGVYNIDYRGHLSLFSGAIGRISALDTDPLDTLPSRPWQTDPNFVLLMFMFVSAALMLALALFGRMARRATTV